MSLQPAGIQSDPHSAPPFTAPSRRLQPVTAAPAARRRPKIAYAALAVGGAIAIGIAQMTLSLASTQDAFVLAQLNSQQQELTLQKHALSDEIVGLSSPQALASRADAMGLVVAGAASYLRISDGKVLGSGDGADWMSTVHPNGANVVGNSLLTPPPVADAEPTTPADSTAQPGATPPPPPTVTDGLPSPTTR
ncbi:Cell division protein FtsL [Microbacterium esteraromaticum]|uniref:Cell division protein FtsL n=1 Tax=Microbacterium esteraromaticum TaxID=57043 RepID=A0A1R4II71_9MICO|nr:hypothetical protein [Microbacterium esteraromaticum]SJN19516.1 Cell division protein FtsL [Microbacterium esteraromaticum]